MIADAFYMDAIVMVIALKGYLFSCAKKKAKTKNITLVGSQNAAEDLRDGFLKSHMNCRKHFRETDVFRDHISFVRLALKTFLVCFLI